MWSYNEILHSIQTYSLMSITEEYRNLEIYEPAKLIVLVNNCFFPNSYIELIIQLLWDNYNLEYCNISINIYFWNKHCKHLLTLESCRYYILSFENYNSISSMSYMWSKGIHYSSTTQCNFNKHNLKKTNLLVFLIPI